MALGIAPPRPSPVKSRKKTSVWSEVAVAVRSDPMPNKKLHATSTGFRPKRSARGPHTRAPIIMPKQPRRNHLAQGRARDFQLCRERSRTKPMAWASNPSMNTSAPQDHCDEHLKAAERLLIDKLPNVEDSCLFHETPSQYDRGLKPATTLETNMIRKTLGTIMIRKTLGTKDGTQNIGDEHGTLNVVAGFSPLPSLNMYFNAACMIRGSPAMRIFPKFTLLRALIGLIRFTRFGTLKASIRNWSE